MSRVLIEKLRKARESGVTVGDRTYTIRRPTDADAQSMESREPIDFLRRFVVGWDLREIDLIPGGSPEPVPFDHDLWVMYAEDHPELWSPIAMEILARYKAHVDARGEAAKN